MKAQPQKLYMPSSSTSCRLRWVRAGWGEAAVLFWPLESSGAMGLALHHGHKRHWSWVCEQLRVGEYL